MTTTMTAPIATGKTDWRPGHVPRLSYRNPLPSGEMLDQGDGTIDITTGIKANRPGLSIREIREALPPQPVTLPVRSYVPTSPVLGQKSKKSFLGGLFAKEPSMAALGQVTQQMMAQHGSISPSTIPHVSSQKMPNHVPRVNSKWDGVPDHIKAREKMERDRSKTSGRNLLRPEYLRSNSSENQEHQFPTQRRNSTAESWDSRSTGSRPVFQDDVSMRPASIYSTSSDNSVNHAQRLALGASQQHGSAYGVRTPDTSLYSLEETPTSPRELQRSPSVNYGVPHDRKRNERYPKLSLQPADTIPDCTSSSSSTPLERSPRTPIPLGEDSKSLDSLLRSSLSLGESVARPGHSLRPTDTRSGQHKVENTSKPNPRIGLELKTSMVAPWETQILQNEIIQSPQKGLSKSRGKGKLFTKEKK